MWWKKNIYHALIATVVVFGTVSATQTTLMTQNFDAAYSGWSTVDLTGDTSLWHKITDHPMDSVSYHSPDTSWWCGVAGTSTYRANMNDALTINQVFDLAGKSAPKLYFWYFLSKENNDAAYVEVSTDSGKTWAQTGTAVSNSNKWLETSYDLSAFIDSTVMIRFRFNSDHYNGVGSYYGWFIDDIRFIDVSGESTIYSNLFDDANWNTFTHRAIVNSDDWDTSNVRKNSSPRSWHASENYESWFALRSPKLDLTGAQNPHLHFNHWYKFSPDNSPENMSNGGRIEITTDTMVTDKEWKKLYPSGGYPAASYYDYASLGNPLTDSSQTGDADVEGYYGVQDTWTPADFDLSDYADSASVWVRFSTVHWAADESCQAVQ